MVVVEPVGVVAAVAAACPAAAVAVAIAADPAVRRGATAAAGVAALPGAALPLDRKSSHGLHRNLRPRVVPLRGHQPPHARRASRPHGRPLAPLPSPAVPVAQGARVVPVAWEARVV